MQLVLGDRNVCKIIAFDVFKLAFSILDQFQFDTHRFRSYIKMSNQNSRDSEKSASQKKNTLSVMWKQRKPYKHSTQHYRKVNNRKNVYKKLIETATSASELSLAASSSVTTTNNPSQSEEILVPESNTPTEHYLKDYNIANNATAATSSASMLMEYSAFGDDESSTTTDFDPEDSGDDDDGHDNDGKKLISEFSCIENLKNWALNYRITHRAVNDLLKILTDFGIQYLPKDSRTFLRTPQGTANTIKPMGDGQYWHYGLKNCLSNQFSDLNQSMEIQLTFNVDGLPIHRSSKKAFWPILCNIHNMPKIQPMVIGIYYGDTKPLTADEFLNDFVDEMDYCLKNGININGHELAVKIRCFVCDTPARAFMKGKASCVF